MSTVRVNISINGLPVHYRAVNCAEVRAKHHSNTCIDYRCFRCFGEEAVPCSASKCDHVSIVDGEL